MTRNRGGLRITMVCSPARFGGVETVVEALAGGLQAAGHTVEVGLVLAAEGDSDLASRLTASGVATRELIIPPREYRRERRLVRELLQDGAGTILHTHGYRCDVVDAPVARRLGIPTVATAHGFTGGGPRNRFYEWLDARALRRFDAVVAVAKPLKARLERAGVPPERVHWIPNALPGGRLLAREAAREALGIAGGGFVVGWVGRISHEKGPDLFIRALALTEDPAVRAALIGTGPDLEEIRRLADGMGVGGRVMLLGGRPGAGSLLRAFDAVVLSSRTEGTPMVVLEAMRAAVPVVAVLVGGVPDILTPDEASLVPPESPAELARAIGAVRRDPRGAARKAELARERFAREFSVEPWVERYGDVYRAVLAGRHRPGR